MTFETKRCPLHGQYAARHARCPRDGCCAEIVAANPRELTTPRRARRTGIAERDFATAFETWLEGRGYIPRTERALADPNNVGKSYIHVREARGNHYLLDYLILNMRVMKPSLELELKVEGGVLRAVQKHILTRHGGKLAWNMDEARGHVLTWEAGL